MKKSKFYKVGLYFLLTRSNRIKANDKSTANPERIFLHEEPSLLTQFHKIGPSKPLLLSPGFAQLHDTGDNTIYSQVSSPSLTALALLALSTLKVLSS